jgi:hypothetical protein
MILSNPSLQSYFSTEARLFANPNLRDLALYKTLGKEMLRSEVVRVEEAE